MTDPLAAELASALEEAVAAQTRLLALTNMQRDAVAQGRGADVERLSRELEVTVMRASQVEERRERAASAIADHHGLAATRWSALREVLDPADLPGLEARASRLESLMRDLEMANAVAGQLIRRELEVVDFSLRTLLGSGPAPLRRYTSNGQVDASAPARAVLLNTVA